MRTSLSVVIPFYNEEKNVESVLGEVGYALLHAHIPYEFICVNNGSRDDTGPILSRLKINDDHVHIVTVNQNQGYGWGVIQGINAASMEWVTIISGDGQVDPRDIVKAYNAMETTGADIIKPRRTTREDGLYRRFISSVYSIVMKLLFGLKGWDFNAPPKIIKNSFLKGITLESKNSFLDPEILIKAEKRKCKIEEVEVTYRKREGGSGYTGIHTIIEFIKDIIRWRLK